MKLNQTNRIPNNFLNMSVKKKKNSGSRRGAIAFDINGISTTNNNNLVNKLDSRRRKRDSQLSVFAMQLTENSQGGSFKESKKQKRLKEMMSQLKLKDDISQKTLHQLKKRIAKSNIAGLRITSDVIN